jgi:thiosulfate dehydrogenase
VKKGDKAPGSGLKDLPFLSRAADPSKGKVVYELRCASCHQPNGQGIIDGIGQSYVYPPLWGPHSFNDAAGLSRISNMAKYVKYNMPLGVSHETPELSDEDAWDVAAYIESQPRPHKSVPQDWPNIAKKPIDHPFGPYADQFSEQQHKYGPFTAMKKPKK